MPTTFFDEEECPECECVDCVCSPPDSYCYTCACDPCQCDKVYDNYVDDLMETDNDNDGD